MSERRAKLVFPAARLAAVLGLVAGCAGSGSQGTGAGGGAGGTPGGGSTGTGGGGGSAGAPDGGSGGAGPGGGGSGGTGGQAGGAGGGAGAGAGGMTGGTIIVSDNFDTATAGQPPDAVKWQRYPANDANGPVVDTARFHSAPNSARVKGTSSGNGSFLVPASGLPAPQNRFYARVWINFQLATSAVTGHNGFLVGADSRTNSGTELRLGISTPPGFSAPMMDLNLQNPKDGGGEVTRFSNGFTTGANPLNLAGFSFAADTWTCVEALFDGGNNAFQVWVGGTEVTNMNVTDFKARSTDPARTMWAPSYSFLKIGAQNYSGDIGTIWYDDIVVGTDRVGCP